MTSPNMTHVLQELQLKELHLDQETSMTVDHKTGLLFDMHRSHVLAMQELDSHYQAETHRLEAENLLESHNTVCRESVAVLSCWLLAAADH